MKKSDIMRVYTKTGDSGLTSLASGTRVRKDHPRLDAYGTIDELNSFVGLLQADFEPNEEKDRLHKIQNRLFVVSSNLAVDDDRFLENLPSILPEDISDLESAMDRLMDQMPPLDNFILPGGSRLSSLCHVCRTVCRRAERQMIQLSDHIEIAPHLVQYINRLSDYFFVLARFSTHLEGSTDIIWTPDFREREKF